MIDPIFKVDNEEASGTQVTTPKMSRISKNPTVFMSVDSIFNSTDMINQNKDLQDKPKL